MKPHSRIAVIILLLVIGFCSQLRAQKARLQFENITTKNGLSHSTIHCILQDTKGFLWFGTEGGLNRYDGYTFTAFTNSPGNPNSIVGNAVQALVEDHSRRIWVGTTEGLTVFNWSTGKFTQYKKGIKGLPHPAVRALAVDHKSNIWIGTEGGLAYFDSKRNQFSRLSYPAKASEGTDSDFITSIIVSKTGAVWIGTRDNSLRGFNPKSGKWIHLLKEQSLPTVTNKGITALFEDREGMLWVGTEQGLKRIKFARKSTVFGKVASIRHYKYDPKNPFSLSHNGVTCITQGTSGNIWIGTDGGGLNRFEPRSGHFTSFKTEDLNPNSLISNAIKAICDDNAATLWIATDMGVSKIDRQSERFKLYQRTAADASTLSNNNIQAIDYDPETGIAWIGTLGGGLNRWNRSTNTFTVFKSKIPDATAISPTAGTTAKKVVVSKTIKPKKWTLFKKNKTRQEKKTPVVKSPVKFKPSVSPKAPLPKPLALSSDRILSLRRESNRTLWIGTADGLNKLSLLTQQLTHYKAYPAHPDSLSGSVVYCILKDRKGPLWLGTDNGLNQFDGRKFVQYLHQPSNPNSLNHNQVRALAQDRSGTVWVGTSGGLSRFDPASKTFTRFLHQYNQPNSLSNNIVYCLYASPDGTIWIGTGEGLNRFDPKKQIFTHYTEENGLPSNFIYGILADETGNLWISTSRGVSKFLVAKGTFKNFDEQDGLQGNDFNPGASFKASNGEMFFGGLHGLNTFEPAHMQDNTFIPPVVITDFKLFNKNIAVGAKGSPLQKHISETDEITLSYQDAVFSFDFIALNFTQAGKNQYAYKMENFEQDWNYVKDRRFASYTNLEPGEYIFRVIGSNNDGVWNEKGTSVKILILPPLWRTWWFYSISVVFVSASVLLVVQLRTRQLQQAKRLLEENINVRTQELRWEKQLLEEANGEILRQKEEIEAQNDMLLDRNQQLLDAKQLLNDAHLQLKAVNLYLEDKIEERTQQLLRLNQELTSANEELDLFIYRISHDLQGPLARFQGLTQVAKLEVRDAAALRFVTLMEREATAMHNLLNNLQVVNVIFNQNVPCATVDFEQMREEILTALQPLITHQFIIIEFDIIQPINFCSAPELLRAILKNLIENALIFHESKEGSYIKVRVHQEESFLHISVADNGIGIQKKHVSKIYNMFFRGSELSRGNGLGLYVVKKAVDKLKGKIELETMEGKGTAFSILLPERILTTEPLSS